MWMMKSSSQILIICLIDEEIENLYSARDIVVKRMIKDEYFNMDNQKWDEMIKEAVQHGYLKDTNECEEILEDMLSWDKLLPDNYYRPDLTKAALTRLSAVHRSLKVAKSGVKKRNRQALKVRGRK
ncbi:hypothetical protein GOBAR_DD01806 [Gossypium barbadense]|nr:hypothetical protein GOBAR_DD01806 [Gossypium barbadense]